MTHDSESKISTGISSELEKEPRLTLNDLLEAESDVLRRLARDAANEYTMAGHLSTTTGHKSSGTHTSHTSAKVERPLDDA